MAESPDARIRRLREALRQRGNGLPPGVSRLGHALWEEGDALSHEECRAALPSFVEAEADGQSVVRLYPAVKHHLDRCDECAAEYVELLEIALADSSHSLPQPETIPAPDLAFLPVPPLSLRELVETWARGILTKLAPAQLRELGVIQDAFFERAEELKGKFSLQPKAGQAPGFGGVEVGPALNALALSYAATQYLVVTLTPGQIDTWVQQGVLLREVQMRALQVGSEIGLDKGTAAGLANAFAEQIAANPAPLRLLVEKR